MSFLEDIKAFQEKVLQQASKNTNAIVYDLFTEVVARSPSPSNPGVFAKGLLANQWYTATGDTPSSDVGLSTNDIGIDSLSRISSTLAENPFLRKDNIVTFANNTEEAIYAEKLGWKAGLGTNGRVWSGNTGPYAMVANSVNYIQGKYS